MGRYRLIRRIAVGGMAEIFLASFHGEAGFERRLIIKKILPTYAGDPEFARRLINEGLLASQLQHANIVQVYDLGKLGADYFIAMEFVDGPDLRDILARARDSGHPVPLPMAVYLLWQSARGLAYAHDKTDHRGQRYHLVHRDISPANVMVSWEGGVKLGDFGIAKARYRLVSTLTGVLQGKFPYMSPEQGVGEEQDQRSDVFSFGTLAYEVLTLKRPFDGETDLKTLDKIRQCQFEPMDRTRSDAPQALVRLVHRCLEKDRNRRFESGVDLERALAEVLRSHGWSLSEKDVSEWLSQLYGPLRKSLAEGIENIPPERIQEYDARPIDPADVSEFGTNPPSFPLRSDPTHPPTRSVVWDHWQRSRRRNRIHVLWLMLMAVVLAALVVDYTWTNLLLGRGKNGGSEAMPTQEEAQVAVRSPTHEPPLDLVEPEPFPEIAAAPPDVTDDLQVPSEQRLSAAPIQEEPGHLHTEPIMAEHHEASAPPVDIDPADAAPEGTRPEGLPGSSIPRDLPPPGTDEPPDAEIVVRRARDRSCTISTAPPGVSVFGDGILLGTSPQKVTVPAGKSVVVRLVQDGYETSEFPLDHPPPAQLMKRLIPLAMGSVKLRYFPASAEVFIDGRRYLGQDGLNIIEARLPEGEHVIRVKTPEKVEERTILLQRDTVWRGTVSVEP